MSPLEEIVERFKSVERSLKKSPGSKRKSGLFRFTLFQMKKIQEALMALSHLQKY